MNFDPITRFASSFKEQTDLLKIAAYIVVGQLMIIASAVVAMAVTAFGWSTSLHGWFLYLACFIWFVLGIMVTLLPFKPRR